MAGPARTVTPIPNRLARMRPKTYAEMMSDRSDGEEHRLRALVAKLFDGKLNNTGTLTLSAGPATTTDIDDSRIGQSTIALLVGIDQNGSASIPTISQSVVSQGKIRLTHAASGLTRTLGYVLFGILMMASAAWAQSPSLIGLPQSSTPACSAGEYWLSVDSTGAKWKKCESGTVSDMDTGGGGGSATLLDQSAGETDLRYDATFEAYYYDTDGDGTRDVDGTEPFLDVSSIEVPQDFATIQDAIESADCKEGSTTANQGCRIVFSGTRAESVVIGSAGDTSQQQWSIIIEGKGTMGEQSAGTNNLCAATLQGDGTLDGTVITVDDSIGVALRNFCIDMDPASGNDPKYGIVVGGDTVSSTGGKHVSIEKISFFGNGAANGAGIKLGNNAVSPPGTPNSDTAFNTIRDIFMEGLRTCIEVDAVQAVGNFLENVHCGNPTATIGGIKLIHGQISHVMGFYYSSGADNQIAINVMNNSLGIGIFAGISVEWDNDNGIVFNYDDSDGPGNLHAQTILGGRINIQTIPSVRHKCINWDRAGTLNIWGLGLESDSSASRTCEIWLRNADTVEASYVNMQGLDVEWAGTQPDIVIDESSAGGPLIVTRDEHGKHAIGQNGTLIFEGATLNGFETTVTVTDPTADRTVTLPDANSNTVVPDTGAPNNFLTGISSGGVISKSQPSFSNISGTASDAQVDGSLESDEITGLTDGQISDTLTASTSTTAAANDNDTSIATTAFVQQEIDDGDFLTDNCVLENDSTPIPDSCVGDGTDGGGGGGGAGYAEIAAAALAGF